ncbi:MAG: tripartite tricarboxylate transporter substrate binding protein [Betaproteobacteria bacterium]|nr:tripartite tricarboxylate transporter substrate binding protein [Betaproteobacteria bacterium]
MKLQTSKSYLIKLIASLAVLALAPVSVGAQNYPNRPIRLVVPYAPGGAVDAFARPMAQKLSDQLGQSVIVENRPGGNATIGADAIAKAPPDGYSIVLTSINHYIVPFFSKNVPYDPVKDFSPVIIVCNAPNILAVHPSMPVQSMQELIDYAKRNPDKLFYGTTGVGSTHHLAGLLLAQLANIDIEHVPYKGGNPTMTDVLAGAIPMVIITASTVMPHARAGKLRPLGVIERQRYLAVADLPAIGETVPGFAVPDTWLGVLGPANLAAPMVTRLNEEIRKAINAPDVKARLEGLGFVVTGNTPAQFDSQLRTDTEVFRKIVAGAGIRPE